MFGEPVKQIKEGDVIVIKGYSLKVDDVISSNNYRDQQGDDWYVEFHSNGKYIYWKQRIDGGYIVSK